MKKLLPIIFVLIITSCSKEVPLEQTVIRNDTVYLINSKKPFTGTTVQFHENGQLEIKRNYKDGELEGLYENYYENGQLEIKGNYKDGELDGFSEYYYASGQLKAKGNYKDGKYEGLWEGYRENGRLKYKNNYKDGKEIPLN